jgi:triacylglycerol lipase
MIPSMLGRRCRWPVALGAVLAALLLAPGASAAGAPQYPVTYSFPHAVASAAQSVTNGPLGANNWSCKPTRAHPYPVVLVHGLIANEVDNWDTMSPLLADTGFCVFALTYGADPGEEYVGGLTDMTQSAAQLGAFVARVLAATHAKKVDLVGHSEGTVMPRYWMEFDGGGKLVSRYVMIAPIWHGTNLAGLGTVQSLATELDPTATSSVLNLFGSLSTCVSCTEFLTGSAFMKHLNTEFAVAGVAYTDIMTRYDELVQPYTSGYLNAPHVTNIVVQNQCPEDFSEHLTVAYDPVVAQDMLNGLDPAHAKPVRCVPVIPFLGAPFPPSGVGLTP